MLRTRDREAMMLGPGDRAEALALCACDPIANVFVASKIIDGCLETQPGTLLGHRADGELRALLWTSANLVPVQVGVDSIDVLAERVRGWRRQCASIFGPAEPVGQLWRRLGGSWGPARAIRASQPVMVASTLPTERGLAIDPRVRFATRDEVDAVLPAAAHMFTEEIGYPPFHGSSRAYRQSIAALIAARRTVVRVEDEEVVFKADVGSVAHGVCQVQGVWLHPSLRGRGLAAPAMAAATELFMRHTAPTASLYVNDFNLAARATYVRCGYRETARFTTVLL